MKKSKLLLGMVGMCALGATMFMGSQQITGTKEMEAFCQQQAIVASAATVSGDAVTGDTVVSGGAVASGASVVTQGAFVADGISYKITGADTVTVNGLESNFEKTVLQIPEQVAYQQQTFTVTSVEMNQLQQCYENVKKIVIPKTVTENVVIKRRYLSEFVKIYNAGVIEEAYDGVTDKDDIKEYGLNGAFKAAYSEELLGSYSTKKYKKSNDLVLALQAFPYLQKMKFLGENAPKKIQVEQYVFDDSAYYQVPAGQKNAYQAVTKKITLHQWKGWSGVVEDSLYISQNIIPDVIETGEMNAERTIFSTNTGVYLVKKSGASGNGKVALLKLKKAKRTYKAGKVVENTVVSKIKNGNYTYTLTEIESGAIKWREVDDKTIAVTLPDTITKLQESSLDPVAPYLFLPKNCQVIGDALFQDQGDMEYSYSTYFCYAPGVKNLKTTPFVTTIYSNKSKNMKVSMYKGKKYKVKKAVEGASIKAPKKVTVKVGKTKKINASFKTKTSETLRYEIIVPVRYEISEQANYKKKIKVSKTGTITAKKAGTYYCMVYSMESGKHEYVKVVVKK